MPNKKSQKIAKKFVCKVCDYYSNNKNDYNKHLQTKKHNTNNPNSKNVHFHFCECGKKYKHSSSYCNHKKNCNFKKNEDHKLNSTKMVHLGTNRVHLGTFQKMSIFEKSEKAGCKKLHICECGKSYKYSQGLSRHKKKCNLYKENTIIAVNEENKDLKEMVKELMVKCTELAEKPTTINNTQFNVMNYLNTECKDAMNLSDFIESFEFSLKDLELLNSHGYQVAMENTFVKQLCDMDKTKRPIHCTDKKRKSFYIKDNDVWEKDKNNEKLIKGMKNLSCVHSTTLNKWKNNNNDWNSNERKQVFYCNSIIEFAKCDKEKERNKIFIKLSELSVK